MDFCLYVFEEPSETAVKKDVAKAADAKKNVKKTDDVLADVLNKKLHIS